MADKSDRVSDTRPQRDTHLRGDRRHGEQIGGGVQRGKEGRKGGRGVTGCRIWTRYESRCTDSRPRMGWTRTPSSCRRSCPHGRSRPSGGSWGARRRSACGRRNSTRLELVSLYGRVDTCPRRTTDPDVTVQRCRAVNPSWAYTRDFTCISCASVRHGSPPRRGGSPSLTTRGSSPPSALPPSPLVRPNHLVLRPWVCVSVGDWEVEGVLGVRTDGCLGFVVEGRLPTRLYRPGPPPPPFPDPGLQGYLRLGSSPRVVPTPSLSLYRRVLPLALHLSPGALPSEPPPLSPHPPRLRQVPSEESCRSERGRGPPEGHGKKESRGPGSVTGGFG